MPDTLEKLFSEISAKASLFGEKILSHICNIAETEAKGKAIPFLVSRQSFVGIWDWDSRAILARISSSSSREVDEARANTSRTAE